MKIMNNSETKVESVSPDTEICYSNGTEYDLRSEMIKEKHTLVNSRALQEYTGYIFELSKLAEDMLKGSRKRYFSYTQRKLLGTLPLILDNFIDMLSRELE